MTDFAAHFSRLHTMARNPLSERGFIKRFVASLHPEISKGISTSGIVEFKDAVDTAIEYETSDEYKKGIRNTG